MSALTAPTDRPRTEPGGGGETGTPGSRSSTGATAAARFRRPGWRDPRLVVGVALVCLSVVLGARVLGTEDEMSPVWSAAAPVAAGEPITAEDVRATRVRFDQAGDAARYLAADEPWSDVVALRDVTEGELMPAAAVGTSEPELSELPLAAQSSGVPIGLSAGDRVDVWTVPLARTASRAPSGRQVLSDVPVLRVGGRGVSGPESTRQVVVGVPAEADLGGTVGRLADSHVVLVRRP